MILVGNDHSQSQTAYNLFKIELLLVVLELLWVLKSVYKFKRSSIIDSLSDLILMPVLKFKNLEAFQNFIIAAKNSKYDLSGLLLAHAAGSYDCETVFLLIKRLQNTVYLN